MRSGRAVAAALALIPFTALGLARFAYGLVLPEMRADLDWSYLEAGVVTTANAAGYLLGAFRGALMARRHGEWTMIVVGVAAMAASLVATAMVSSLALILILRFGAGLFGGWAFIAGGTRAAQLSKTTAPSALVWYPAGAAMAMVITAGGQRIIDQTFGGWRASWVALGLLGALAAGLLALLVPKVDPLHAQDQPGIEARVRGLEVSYGLFGLGYISYITFVVAYIKTGDPEFSTGLFWAVLGASGVVGAFAWPPLFARYSAGAMYPLTLAVCSVGAMAILVDRSLTGALVSAVLFGVSFLAVVSGVTASARDRVEPQGWASAIGWVTVIFGAGQTFGPLLAGALGDTTTGIRLGLGASALVLAVAAVAALADHRTTIYGASPVTTA